MEPSSEDCSIPFFPTGIHHFMSSPILSSNLFSFFLPLLTAVLHLLLSLSLSYFLVCSLSTCYPTFPQCSQCIILSPSVSSLFHEPRFSIHFNHINHQHRLKHAFSIIPDSLLQWIRWKLKKKKQRNGVALTNHGLQNNY